MKHIDVDRLVTRFNIWFVAVSLAFFEFCCLIFPALRDDFLRLGVSLSAVSEFSFAQCSLIERHPWISFAGFTLYYLLSLKIVNAKLQTPINIVLLFYFTFILFGIGLPLR